MNIDYTVQIWQEGGQFIAHAMPLDIMSSGTTPQQAREALQEAVELFFGWWVSVNDGFARSRRLVIASSFRRSHYRFLQPLPKQAP